MYTALYEAMTNFITLSMKVCDCAPGGDRGESGGRKGCARGSSWGQLPGLQGAGGVQGWQQAGGLLGHWLYNVSVTSVPSKICLRHVGQMTSSKWMLLCVHQLLRNFFEVGKVGSRLMASAN